MAARGIVWAGVQTERFAEMDTFLRAVIGVAPPVEEPGFHLWSPAAAPAPG